MRLEIGFGAGEHLIAEASRHRDTGFIGAEPFLNGMASVLSGIVESDLENVRLHQGDAGELLDWLPEAWLSEVDLLYPDPWPKRRHWKRRFIRPDNLTRLARAMRIGGVLRFATDWSDYATWGLAQVVRTPHFRWTAETAADWRAPWPDWQGTRYEAKAFREGRRPVYLTFERVDPSA